MSQDAYELIIEFLRNNLDDEDYAEYSKALDELAIWPKPVATFKRYNKGGGGEVVHVTWKIPELDIPDEGDLFMLPKELT